MILVDSADTLDALEDALDAADGIAVDTETPEVEDWFRPELRTVQIAVRLPAGVEVFVVDVLACPDLDRVAWMLSGRVVFGWNATFDARVLDRCMTGPAGAPALRWRDGMLSEALLWQGRSGWSKYRSLAWAAKFYCGIALSGKEDVRHSFDRTSPLTDEQAEYAAADAEATLLVCEHLAGRLEDAGLTAVDELEQGARPFVDRMERAGLPVDREGWDRHLANVATETGEALTRVADLSGGGQGGLFGGVEPTFNPASSLDVARVLNDLEAERVRVWLKRDTGQARLFRAGDSIDADTIRGVGGELADAILEWRSLQKVLTTYGDNLWDDLHDDGRFHPRYWQVTGTDTGRLASSKPNAQNQPPALKPYLRPEPGRVFAYADLSQAELRYLAQVSGDAAMTAAFRAGTDIHQATAQRMFSVDMAALKVDDPDHFSLLRKRAKVLNFGIAYGTGPTALARSLTLQDIPTTEEEGKGLLDAYMAGYPSVRDYLKGRDRQVRDRVEDLSSGCDWELTFRLWSIANTEPDGRTVEDRELWDRHEAAVCVDRDGQVLRMFSVSASGRRTWITMGANQVIEPVLKEFCDGLKDAKPANKQWRFTYGRELWDDDRDRLIAGLDRQIRRAWSMLAPKVRNHPIQGGVADVMLAAMAELNGRLPAGWEPVQMVHDSLLVECPEGDGVACATLVKEVLESAFRKACPDVPARADADVRTSASDKSVVTVIEDAPEPPLLVRLDDGVAGDPGWMERFRRVLESSPGQRPVFVSCPCGTKVDLRVGVTGTELLVAELDALGCEVSS